MPPFWKFFLFALLSCSPHTTLDGASERNPVCIYDFSLRARKLFFSLFFPLPEERGGKALTDDCAAPCIVKCFLLSLFHTPLSRSRARVFHSLETTFFLLFFSLLHNTLFYVSTSGSHELAFIVVQSTLFLYPWLFWEHTHTHTHTGENSFLHNKSIKLLALTVSLQNHQESRHTINYILSIFSKSCSLSLFTLSSLLFCGQKALLVTFSSSSFSWNILLTLLPFFIISSQQ